ncbi:MAG: hypothetical protein RLZZ458_333, partial [Planctomycetota bacterium]
FNSRIRRNIKLAEAPGFGQSVLDYAPESHGAVDYQAMANEVLDMEAVTTSPAGSEPGLQLARAA